MIDEALQNGGEDALESVNQDVFSRLVLANQADGKQSLSSSELVNTPLRAYKHCPYSSNRLGTHLFFSLLDTTQQPALLRLQSHFWHIMKKNKRKRIGRLPKP